MGALLIGKEQYMTLFLRTMRACNEMLRPGMILKDYQEEVGKLVQSELLQLELISQKDIDNQNPDQPAYKKYFMHVVQATTSGWMFMMLEITGNLYAKVWFSR